LPPVPATVYNLHPQKSECDRITRERAGDGRAANQTSRLVISVTTHTHKSSVDPGGTDAGAVACR